TRPSDLPLNVIVESGNSQAKVVLQMTPPLFGAKWKSPRSLSLTHVKYIFFTKQGSQCILYGFREGSPLHAFVIRNRTYMRIRTSNGFGQGIFCQDTSE